MGVVHAGGLAQHAADRSNTWIYTEQAAECSQCIYLSNLQTSLKHNSVYVVSVATFVNTAKYLLKLVAPVYLDINIAARRPKLECWHILHRHVGNVACPTGSITKTSEILGGGSSF